MHCSLLLENNYMLKFLDYMPLKEELDISLLKDSYLFACHKDIEIIKPGNVNINSAHLDTNAEDYIVSSINSSNKLFKEDFSLGDRVLESITETKKVTKVNTNLGIILLCAPIIHAFINYNQMDLKNAISNVIDNATIDDTLKICEAINIANPGGLGKNEKYDTRSLPPIELRKIMGHSSSYDRISYQYNHNFIDILNFIVPRITFHLKNSHSLDISLSLTFLEIMSKIPDSHISRKLGDKIAKKTSNHANDLLKILDKESSHEYLTNQLSKLDYEYKKKGINPGTTADLLLASLMIYKIFISN